VWRRGNGLSRKPPTALQRCSWDGPYRIRP
jgi:hypothetical protein